MKRTQLLFLLIFVIAFSSFALGSEEKACKNAKPLTIDRDTVTTIERDGDFYLRFSATCNGRMYEKNHKAFRLVESFVSSLQDNQTEKGRQFPTFVVYVLSKNEFAETLAKLRKACVPESVHDICNPEVFDLIKKNRFFGLFDGNFYKIYMTDLKKPERVEIVLWHITHVIAFLESYAGEKPDSINAIKKLSLTDHRSAWHKIRSKVKLLYDPIVGHVKIRAFRFLPNR